MTAETAERYMSAARMAGVEIWRCSRGWKWAHRSALDRPGGPDAVLDIRGPFPSPATAAANAAAELHISIR